MSHRHSTFFCVLLAVADLCAAVGAVPRSPNRVVIDAEHSGWGHTYGFTGDGVLDWEPEDLGFEGDRLRLRSISINFVGVFLGADGKIMEVVPPQRK